MSFFLAAARFTLLTQLINILLPIFFFFFFFLILPTENIYKREIHSSETTQAILGPVPLFVLLIFLTSIIVGFTPTQSYVRLAGLPIAASITYTILQTASEHMRSPWASLFCGSSVGFLLQYIELSLSSRWSFENRGPLIPPKRDKTESVSMKKDHSKKSISNCWNLAKGSWFECFYFGLRSTFTFRNLNTTWEVKNTPLYRSSDPSYVPSRKKFVIWQILLFNLSYLFLDAIQQSPPPPNNAELFSLNAVPFITRLSDITADQLVTRTLSTLIYWVSMYSVIQGVTSFAACVAVSSHIDRVENWRPLFGSPLEAYTIRRFWRCVPCFISAHLSLYLSIQCQ